MNRDKAIAWAFTLWAAATTSAFIWFNGGKMWSKLLERLATL